MNIDKPGKSIDNRHMLNNITILNMILNSYFYYFRWKRGADTAKKMHSAPQCALEPRAHGLHRGYVSQGGRRAGLRGYSSVRSRG